jgi:hypothetical protein
MGWGAVARMNFTIIVHAKGLFGQRIYNIQPPL